MKRIVLAGMVVIAMVAGSTLGSNFNTISHDGWTFRINTPFGLNDHNHQEVFSKGGHPTRFGTRSERVEIRPGDCGITMGGHWSDCDNDRERVQMSSLYYDLHFYSGDEYWYRWSLFIPFGHTNLTPVKVSFAEFKHKNCPVVFQFEETTREYESKGEISLRIAHSTKLRGAEPLYVLETNYVGKWLDFVIFAKWSQSDDGRFRIWINGNERLDHRGQNMLCSDSLHFKYGVYRSFVSRNQKAGTMGTVAYHDGIRVSKTKDGMFAPLGE